LESATETLSEYLERDITSENLADIKQKVQDKYRYETLLWVLVIIGAYIGSFYPDYHLFKITMLLKFELLEQCQSERQ
jgi:hypothetical protein